MKEERKTNETLLSKSYTNFKAAELLLSTDLGDEGTLNIAGYLLQQTVELALKHIIEMNGFEYPKTHDISVLLDKIDEVCTHKIDENIIDTLYLMSGTITQMESKTRYIKNYLVSKRSISQVKELIIKLLPQIDKSFNTTLGRFSD